MNSVEYGKADGRVFKLAEVVSADFSKLPELEVLIHLSTGQRSSTERAREGEVTCLHATVVVIQ